MHLIFDILASASALCATILIYYWRLADTPRDPSDKITAGYAIALVVGAVMGGYGLGTLNLMLTGEPGLGRSILGALAGTIFAVETFKYFKNIKSSTGIIFVAGFSTSVTIGRLGCLFSDISDQTHGIETTVAWARDFGDGILRHPVQAYESLAMALFLAAAFIGFYRRHAGFMANGFYLMVGYYAAQRFIWEFFKPYGQIIGPLNLFHIICLILLAYAGTMIARNTDART